MGQPTNKTKVKRVPKRGIYDKETIYRILDREFICHVGFVHDGYPVVIPTLYGRDDNHLFLHGSMASRMMKNLAAGIDVSLSIAIVNGLVIARSAFHHSANYESVVLFGKMTPVEDYDKKMAGLSVITNHIVPGRWDECRQPSAKEMKGTMLLRLLIDEASAKIREGGPVDDKEDYDLDIWAGTVPIQKYFEAPLADPLLTRQIDLPSSVLGLNRWPGKI